MLFLPQGVAAVIKFGEFVDKSDGVTLKTDATTITDIDHATTGIFLSKNGADAAVRHQNVTASVADDYGMMTVTLDTTDTNTLGTLDVLFAKAATYLPVHKSFMVIPVQVYNSIVGGSDLLDVSAAQFAGQTITAAGTVAMVSNTAISNLDAAVSSRQATAAAISNLDAAVSSRMAANANISNLDAAVSSRQATSALISNLDAAVSSRMASNANISNLDAAISTRQTTISNAGLISNLDAAVSSRATDAMLTSVNSQEYIIGATVAKLEKAMKDLGGGTSYAVKAVSDGEFSLALASTLAPISNLDAAVSSRMASNSAISNLDAAITSRMAANAAISNLDAAISSRMVSNAAISNLDAAISTRSTLAAGAKMDLIDVPNPTAVTAIQAGLSKPGTAQTITPVDTAAAGTAQATITKIEGLIQNSGGNRFTAKALETAPTGGGSSLSAQDVRDAMKLAPTAGAPAAGSIDKQLDDVPADVDTALSASHTGGAWGSGSAGIRTITIITELADHTRVGNVHVAVYNDHGDFVKDITTSSNGTATITLDDGTFTFPGFLMLYNIAIVSQAISANATVTITCVPAAEPAPTAGVQTMRFSARAMGASVLDTSAVITATFTTPNEDVNGATISSASAAVLNTGTQTWDLPLTIGATARIVGDGANGRFYQKDITVTSAAVSVPSDYD